MKISLAARRTWLGAAFATWALLPFGMAASAQAPANVPPAYGIAQRLQAEAVAAENAGNGQTAHNRYYQAVKQLQIVVASKTYGKTDFAKQSLRQQAAIEEHKLQDKNAAI